MPHFSSVPGTKFSTKTSAVSTSFSRISCPSSERGFSDSDRLERLYSFHQLSCLPNRRRSSPTPGRSTLITSAPKSASICVSMFPAARRARSSTRRPESGEPEPSSNAVGSVTCSSFPQTRALDPGRLVPPPAAPAARRGRYRSQSPRHGALRRADRRFPSDQHRTPEVPS